MKIVSISDTHNLHDHLILPHGDVLIHCGDFSSVGKYSEIYEFMKWFKKQPHKHKIIVPGNHEVTLCPIKNPCIETGIVNLFDGVHYLVDSGVEIDGVRFWGSPWCGGCQSIMSRWGFYDNGDRFDTIPLNVDILITHSPPFGIGDTINNKGESLGSQKLLNIVKRIRPIAHFFGHIHGGFGIYYSDYTTYYNCSNVNENYDITNNPIIMEF